MNELKPCPKCGSNNIRKINSSVEIGIECIDCDTYGYWEDEETAIREWNNRPLEDALRAEIATLQKERDEAVAYANKLVEQIPFLPKDIEDLREANAKFAQENQELKAMIAAANWRFVTDDPASQPDKTDDYLVLKKSEETYSVYCGWASDKEVIAWKEWEGES